MATFVAADGVAGTFVGLVVSVEPLIDLLKKLCDQLKTPDTDDVLEAVDEALQLLETVKDMEKTFGEKKRDRFRQAVAEFQRKLQKYLDKKGGFLDLIKVRDVKLRTYIKTFSETLNKLEGDFLVATSHTQVEHNRKHAAFMDRTWTQLNDLHKKQDEHREELERVERVMRAGRDHEPVSFEDEKWTSSVKRETKNMDVKQETELVLVKRMCEATDECEAENIARALCGLAGKIDEETASKWRNAIKELVSALSPEDLSHRWRRKYAARVLRRFPVDVLDGKKVLPLLAEVVKPNPEDPDGQQDEQVVTAACAVIAKLVGVVVKESVDKNGDDETPLVLENLVESMVELVSTGSPHQQKHAADILRELAVNKSCADKILTLGGIKALVDALYVGHSSDHRCGALGALWNLAAEKEARQEIVDEGGVDTIVEQLHVDGNEEQRQLAASALAVLAWDDESDDLIGAAGGVELLVQVLRSGTTMQKISSVHALSQLANNESNATKMVRAKAVRLLVASLRVGTGSERQSRAGMRSKAGEALALIA